VNGVCDRGLGLSPSPDPRRPLLHLNSNTFYCISYIRNNVWCSGQAILLRRCMMERGPGVEPHGPIKFLTNQTLDQKPINRCHVAALDWATWHPNICPNHAMCHHNTRPMSTNQIFPRHLPCRLPHVSCTVCTDRYSQHKKKFPIWLDEKIAIYSPYGLRLRK
jgi:hypothetical protein